MSSTPFQSDFARLTSAWLDGSATTDEIAQLRKIIAEDPACAEHFARVARFEPLPLTTADDTAVPFEPTVLSPSDAPSHAGSSGLASAAVSNRRKGSQPAPFRLAAAVVVFLGLAVALLWQFASGPRNAGNSTRAAVMGDATTADRRRTQTASQSQSSLLSVAESPPFADLGTLPPGPEGRTLPDRLDQFYLASVNLDRVPLNQAIGLLQGQLQELNFLNAEVLQKLRITIPTAAAGRPVTFHSGAISFLKAVRAVAGLAGCDVVIENLTLALVLNHEIYPQLAERRDLRDLLSASSVGGKSASDLERLAALLADALALGIAFDPNRPLEDQTFALITRGQWAALQTLASARDQLSQLDFPNYELYITDTGPDASGHTLAPGTVEDLRRQFQERGNLPVAVIAPDQSAPVDADGSVPTFTAQPLGETTHITVNLPADGPDAEASGNPALNPMPTAFEGTLVPGQGITLPLPLDSFLANNNRTPRGLLPRLTFLPLSSRAIARRPITMLDLYISAGAIISTPGGLVKGNGSVLISTPASSNGALQTSP